MDPSTKLARVALSYRSTPLASLTRSLLGSNTPGREEDATAALQTSTWGDVLLLCKGWMDGWMDR